LTAKSVFGRLFIFFMACLYFFSCSHPLKSISFYYWKTNFHLDSSEIELLRENKIKAIYTRYFDIDFATGDSVPAAISPIHFDNSGYGFQIIPVVYIKNRVFELLDSAGLRSVLRKAYSLVSQINNSIRINPAEIQFDCDWTETTKEKYFRFIKQYRLLSNQLISATIRLHQVKYALRTGVPPVDYGVLMYYNMGEINPGPGSSIYENSIAEKYNTSIGSYPLQLAAALPIFSWGLQISDGRVVKLLSKLNFHDFENDSNFIETKKGWFTVRNSLFKKGYYFKEKDIVKLEHVPQYDLLDIINQLNKHSSNRIDKLIFFDLDKTNLSFYDKDLFREIASGSY